MQMVRILCAGLSLLWPAFNLSAQYYFQDIVSAKQSEEQYKLMKKLNIKKVDAVSLDPDGQPTDNFVLYQRINHSAGEIATYSKSDYTGTSVITSRFNQLGQVAMVVDSSTSIVTRTEYLYTPDGKLKEMSARSSDANQTFSVNEKHIFSYDAAGKLSGLLRVKGNTDTTLVQFIADENGLPGEEHWIRKGQKVETWYYYYDEDKNLTDVVRYNARAKRMLPDYVFEYQQDGRLASKTTVNPGTGQYRVWSFQYQANGLKKSETVLNKYKQREGSITYSYQ